MPKDLIQLARDRKAVNAGLKASTPEPVAPEPVADEPESEVEADDDLSKLLKAELVELAEAEGIDTDGLTKAELLDALNEGA
jgi:hypothetical protein